MLLVAPFGARLIPSKPLEYNTSNKFNDKNSDEDLELGDEHLQYPNNSDTNVTNETVTTSSQDKVKLNPFKLVWLLLMNKVRLRDIL